MSGTDDSQEDFTSILRDAVRLAALTRTGLPDSGPEPSFDRLTRLAAKVLRAPVALVSLVDAERQFFKSCFGLPEPWATQRETPLSHSFCQHVITSSKPLVIDDARLDPRVKDNRAVADIGVIAYLGIPLAIDNQVIGAFCAIDGKPRTWTDEDVAMLTDLAGSVITEIRLRADQQEILRQRYQFQVTLSSIGDAVIATDAAGTITFINPVAAMLCGWSEGEAIGKPLATVFRIVAEDSRQIVENPVAKVLAEGHVVGLANHTLLIARDGTEWPIDDSAAPIRNALGDIEGVVLIFREISDRRRTEVALQDARLRLANALSAGLIATWTWDILNDRISADENLARLFSVTPEDAQGGPLSSYTKAIHPDDLPRVAQHIGDTIAHGTTFEMEYRVVQADGSVRWVVARGSVERDQTGRAVSMPGVVVDLTDRKMAEAALHRSQERYRILFESMDEGFCVVKMLFDVDGNAADYRYLEVNPAFEKYTGWRDVIGRRVRELAPGLESHWFEAFGRVARTGEPVRLENEAREVGDRWYDVYAFRFSQADHSQVALLFNDITHRKRAEREREHLVEQLRDADRRKDEFLAMLAHELRNPLGVISNGIQLVQTVQQPEMLTQIREMIHHQVVHLTHLIDDLLDVSRITQGKIELRKQTVELSVIVDRALEMVKPLAAEKHHELAVFLPDRPVRFVADPTRAEQILGNLLTNAAKYSAPYGSIHLTVAVEEEELVFRVRDQGDGISVEMLPKIFGLFTQVDPTIDRSRGGLGIGLTLVQSLIEMHGGTVSASSEGKGKGSEFTVRMPIGQPTADEQPPAHREQGPPKASSKVLVVDDNVETVKLTARLLKHHGFQVETAHDGHDAVQIARKFRPTAVLLDIGLPGLNGYEVAALLRQDDCCKDTCLIAISGYGEEQSRERSRLSGFDHHLTKPIDFTQLMTLISKEAS